MSAPPDSKHACGNDTETKFPPSPEPVDGPFVASERTTQLISATHGPVVLRVVLIVIAVEALLILALPVLEPFLQVNGLGTKPGMVVVKSLVLVMIAAPLICLWAIRPFSAAQRRAETALRDAIESISEGFSMYDAEDRLILCNSRQKELHPRIADVLIPGKTFEEIVRTGVQRGQYPDAIGREEEWIAERLRQHREQQDATELQLAPGRWVKVLETRTANGNTVGIRTDITDLKARERQLRESEERYRRLIELSPDGILVHRNGKIVYCNAALTRMLDAAGPERIVGNDVRDILPDDDISALPRQRFPMSDENGSGLKETAYRRMDGSIVHVEQATAAVPWQGRDATLILLRDITGRIAREMQFRQIVNSLQEGFVLYDAQDRLVLWNDKWLEHRKEIYDFIEVGMPFEQLIRSRIARNHFPEAIGREESFLAERLAQHRNPTEPYLRQTSDGNWFVVRKVKTEDGGIFALSIDITDLKNAENTAQEARMQAEQAASVKSAFLANMSHELRTPLNAVIGFAEMLKNQSELNIAPDRVIEYIDAIHDSGQHLLNLINDLLDFSKIEAGKLDLREGPVNLAALFASLSGQVARQAENAGLQFALPKETDLPTVLADELRLRQVLLNLLSNAIKFTPAGGCVDLQVSKREDGSLAISVRDTGIGMSSEVLGQLGESFRQFGSAYAREQSGTGLGVSIAMALAKLHDGELVYESEPGKGTTATLLLPGRRVVAAPTQRRSTA